MLSKGNRFLRSRVSGWIAFFIMLWLFMGTFLLADTSSAHTRSESFSKWRLKERSEQGSERDTVFVSVTMRIQTALRIRRNASAGRSFDQLFLKHTVENLVLLEEGVPCPVLGEPKFIYSPETGYVRVEWQLRCHRGTRLTIENNAYFDWASTHSHIARMAIDDHPVVEKLFTRRDRTWEIRGDLETEPAQIKPGPVGSSLFSYWVIGVDHIVSGLDHLAFLLGLLLLCRRPREVIILVTGFTLGHSVTLVLGVVDVIHPDPKAVEALIGFTIALVAVENVGGATGANRAIGLGIGIAGGGLAFIRVFFLKSGPPALTLAGLGLFSLCYLGMISRLGDGGIKLRPAVTLLFGMVHGFGFAGGLREIGLPTDRFVSALFGFNVGVETGQLIVVFLLWQLGRSCVRLLPAFQKRLHQRIVTDFVSATLCGLGVFWLLTRAYA
jgi:hypothetical protein